MHMPLLCYLEYDHVGYARARARHVMHQELPGVVYPSASSEVAPPAGRTERAEIAPASHGNVTVERFLFRFFFFFFFFSILMEYSVETLREIFDSTASGIASLGSRMANLSKYTSRT